MARVDDAALDLIFREARTLTRWTGREVADATLRDIWELARLGPTSANCSPMRILFVKSVEAKARLKPHLSRTNVEQTMAAPVTAVVAHDLAFYELLPRLFEAKAVAWFKGNAEETAFRNGTLQGAYLMIAARALGLDCGPMSGFDNKGVDAAFFAGTSLRSNFLVNLGYGDRAGLEPRKPRLAFDEACGLA
jgi:3-hydroxypropanoate dehydrogenase